MSKRMKAIGELVTLGKNYSGVDAIDLLKKLPAAKFAESVDLSVNLGVDPRKSSEVIRGSVVLPNGTGKKVRVAVFTSEGNTADATKAGADIVGLDDLAAEVKKGKLDFDIVLATPDAMRVVGKLGQILGPRGLMPNPKDGTVSADIVTAVNNAKMGQVKYRTDKAGIIHCTIGKVNFKQADLTENLNVILAALKKAKPSSAKGAYFKKITLSTTMGPGISVDISSLGI